MAKTIRVDPMTFKKGRPGRAYWQHKRMDPKGDSVLSNGKIVDRFCDHPWDVKNRRETKVMTRRLVRRKLNLLARQDE